MARSRNPVEALMVEWRARVLQPEEPDRAYLRGRCNGTARARAAKRRRPAPRLGHVVTGAGDRWSFGHALHIAAACRAWHPGGRRGAGHTASGCSASPTHACA